MSKKNLFKKIITAMADSYKDDVVVPAVVKNIEKADGKPAIAFNLPPANLYPLNQSHDRKFRSNVSFETLRQFSVVYDVARACINHRKRQISNLGWAIVPVDPEKNKGRKEDPRIVELTKFFLEPYTNVNFRTFIDKMMEDLLVFDGITLWKDKKFSGELAGLLNVDTSTIRLKIANDGTTPEAPDTAYAQLINGEIHEEYTTEQMFYKMINPRTNTPYGLSPLESLVLGVDSALRSQVNNLELLREGNVPEGFFTLPKEWKTEQIKEFQVWFDAMMSGTLGGNTRLKFMPEGTYTATKKPEDMQFLAFEKWLLLKTCAMFDVMPQDIGFTEHINKSSSESQQEQGNLRGLIPTALFLKEFFDEIIRKDFGITDLRFEWLGLQATDEEFELKRDETMIKNGGLTIDEWRVKQGLEPFGLEATQKPIVMTTQGPILMEGITMENQMKEPEPKAEPNPEPAKAEPKKKEDKNSTKSEIKEVKQWRKKALNKFKKGQVVEFEAHHLNSAVASLIGARLSLAKTKHDVKVAFAPFIEKMEEDLIIDSALKLEDDIIKHKRNKYGSDRQNS